MNNNIYYLYVLLDPRKPGLFKYDDLVFNHEPFYVGISKIKKRYFEHLYEAYNLNIKTHKCNKIRKIKEDNGNDPIVLKIFENISKNEVIKLETEYIKKIGRSDLKNGSLTNQTDGGDGTSGHIYSEEQNKQKSERTIKLWKDESWRKNQIKIIREYRKNNLDMKEKSSKSLIKNYINNPKLKENVSKRFKKLWKDESWRNKIIKSRSNPTLKNKAKITRMKNFEKNPLLKLKYATRIRKWLIIYPDGKEKIIENMSEFCRQNNLSNVVMTMVGKGKQKHHKNFKCKKLEE